MDLHRQFTSDGKPRLVRSTVPRARFGGEVRTCRVGEMMIAPISRLPRGLSRLRSFSSTGITNARVFPDPVTAWRCPTEGAISLGGGGDIRDKARFKLTSTTTSLCCMNSGIVLACTGVICSNPRSRITSELRERDEGSVEGDNAVRVGAHTQHVSAGLTLDHGPA